MERSCASSVSRWLRFSAVVVGGGGRALPELGVLGAGLRCLAEVGVGVALSLGRGSGRAVCAEVGVLEFFGVADLEPEREDSRGGGAHSLSSIRCTGRRRERIDCTGGPPVNFEGTGGGGLDGSCCA